MSTDSWADAFAASRSQVPVEIVANRACRVVGCLNLTDPGSRYCDRCQPITPFDR